MHVSVANGDRIPSGGLCPAMALQIATEEFHVDCYSLPLEGFDLVLGIQWLQTLGPILWDFEALTMSFWHADRKVQWCGLGAPTTAAQTYHIEGADMMESLLSTFDELFAQPTTLPPDRARDHHIHLSPGTPPVSVHPYRYPQFLKD